MDEICYNCGELNENWDGNESHELCLDCKLIKADLYHDFLKEN